MSLPTQPKLKRLLNDYGIKRSTGARWMGVAEITFDRYCLPQSSKHCMQIPIARWKELLRIVKEHAHPNEEVEI
jgi:hypothetical protein